MQQVSQHVQVYTPVMLNRPPGGCHEPDPKYFRNASTMETGLYDPVTGCGAACWNILNHLDDGVLSELDQAPLINTTAPSTLHTHLFPITPIELGDGFVIGSEKVITKVSGTFRNAAAKTAVVYVYEDCQEIAEARTGGPAVAGVRVGPGEVAVELATHQQAVVVWGRPSLDIQ